MEAASFVLTNNSINIHRIVLYYTPEQYKTILTNNVTKTYQKVERITQLNIDREAKTIFKTLQLEKRMERYAEGPTFIP